MDFTLNEREFIDLITLMPKLRELRMEENFLINPLPNENNSVIDSTSLCSIYIKSQNQLEFLVRSLPRNIVENLNLDLYVTDNTLLENLLRRQTTIKKILMRRCTPSITFMKELKLIELKRESLDHVSEFNYLKELLTCQKNLVHLDLTQHCVLNDEIMVIIARMPNLEILMLSMHIPTGKVPYLSQLSKLKHFQIKDCKHTQGLTFTVFYKLSLLKNFSIEKLNIDVTVCTIPPKVYQQMGVNFINLKHLKISCIYNKRDEKIKINTLVENFPNLESLDLCYGHSAVLLIYYVYKKPAKTFPKLKKLKIEFRTTKVLCDQSHIHNLKTIFPNVKELLIEENISISPKHVVDSEGCIMLNDPQEPF